MRKSQNRDVVVVALGEDVTLKRFSKMGDAVLFTPENKKYEPIQVKEEEARVLGIVVAIIKKLNSL